MKKLLLSAAVALVALTANAQEEVATETVGFAKSDLYVSGTVGYSSEKDAGADDAFNTITFSPSVGYFVTENIAVEANLNVGYQEQGDASNNEVGGGLAAVYFFTPANQFSFTTALGVNYTSTFFDEDQFAVAVVPGVNYFVSNSVALRASVGALSYTSTKADGASDSDSDFGLGLNLSNINFGITYKF